MGAEKIAISFPPELVAGVRSDAEAEGKTVSGWLADAAARKLRRKAADAALRAFERKHGAITDAELARVRALWPG